MDNESTVLTDLPETDETSSAFDEGWDEMFGSGKSDDGQADDSGVTDTGEAEEESEGTEADADQQEADGTEGEEGTDSEGEVEGSPDQGGSYTIKYLGEEKVVSGDDIVPTLQKGMDYDRIREKWDGAQGDLQDIPKLRMYERFLQDLADARRSDIESLMDETRTRTILAMAEAKGEKMDPAAAAAQAVRARMQRPEETPVQKPGGEQKPNDMIGRFLSVYRDVKAEDIPKEVWEEAAKEKDLLGPYQRYVNRKLEEDNKRLKKELEQAKQQQNNRERSMGSSRSVGSAAAKDPFDEGWDDAW